MTKLVARSCGRIYAHVGFVRLNRTQIARVHAREAVTCPNIIIMRVRRKTGDSWQIHRNIRRLLPSVLP